ncbi:2OG-Fe(II) oxygenase [Burkholderia gladioli pv. gladioli]|uniref:2OG-Fe(II) oxygenase superfamily protein n=1 Tax=Burkholderia gladioli TaxID=28095 RepID=A0AAW3EW44_BURGA|nr:2OG-Fe(II) oxygenase [Burkholderia gladioli]AJW98260.1 2OG-Fe(II) oxygenase superfamily protein [Burkholderia gladioli]KGC10961.1 2OG-Fe(II) oxygenase superfamily protein [Burkholderia gladioli]MDJ1164271.1 2OG-Fe(II) oxygenase [Burkholderia gladioli pv. gladioli]QPQ84110.1 2OG-Fe(II) oxygenase [Burkholderia gladioli]
MHSRTHGATIESAKNDMNSSIVRQPRDLVPIRLQERIAQFTHGPIWQYGKRSSKAHDRYAFWCAHFAGGNAASRVSCEPELAENRSATAIYELWNVLKAGPLAGHEPLRVYANAHTYGVEGYVHTDSDDAENYFSTIYYAHPVWHRNWGGETVFYSRTEANAIIDTVYPEPGMAVTFPGAIPHCAKGPTRDCIDLRVTVVIKTQRSHSG